MIPLTTMTASREIYWNVRSVFTLVGMYGLLVIAMIFALFGIYSRVELWRSGKADPDHTPTFSGVVRNFLEWGLFQRGVVKRPAPGMIHTLIYFGFLVLLFTTTMVFIHEDLGIRIYQGDFYLFVTIMSDVFGLGLIIGCALAFHRRWIAESPLLHNKRPDAMILVLLVLLCFQGFIIEGLRISVTHDPWAEYSPVGLVFSKFFWTMSDESARLIHKFMWWFHTVTVMSIIAVAPYTKFFHLISSLTNVSLRGSKRPKGALPFPGDLEQAMESAGDDFSIGLGTIKDYTWKELLDLDACTSCGRCQDVCPAYNTDKPLSPKWVILDSRNHMLSLHAQGALAPLPQAPAALRSFDALLLQNFLASAGVNSADRSFRAPNKAVQDAVRDGLGSSVDARISGEVIDPNAFWSCTTCMACVAACPVSINHVDQIIGNRRNMVLMQGEIPHEAQATLRSIEGRGNPYGPQNERAAWAKELGVHVLQPGDSVDYLYWVGCVSSFDSRKQKIAKALVQIMKAAGLSFGILGSLEGCTGDPARRLGEENLFQTLAKKNIATLQSISFKYIVASCPHCFNSIKNEYPQLGSISETGRPKVVHHSMLLRELLESGRITVKESAGKITFHDPCYLGRYNDEYEAPREAIKKASSLQILEMEESRERGMCCGAGGGHFWMDLKIGTRINKRRVEQAAATGASSIATACPFCMQMMEDGVKLNNLEDKMTVQDIAEIIAANLCL